MSLTQLLSEIGQQTAILLLWFVLERCKLLLNYNLYLYLGRNLTVLWTLLVRKLNVYNFCK